MISAAHMSPEKSIWIFMESYEGYVEGSDIIRKGSRGLIMSNPFIFLAATEGHQLRDH